MNTDVGVMRTNSILVYEFFKLYKLFEASNTQLLNEYAYMVAKQNVQDATGVQHGSLTTNSMTQRHRANQWEQHSCTSCTFT